MMASRRRGRHENRRGGSRLTCRTSSFTTRATRCTCKPNLCHRYLVALRAPSTIIRDVGKEDSDGEGEGALTLESPFTGYPK